VSLGPSHYAFAALLALVAVARVAELLVARAHTKKAAGRGEAPRPEPIFILMVALHTVPFWAAPLEVLWLERPFTVWLAAASAAALALAAVLRFWTLKTLGAMWNVRIVKPGHVVTEGPYRYLRHPNYLVVITELFFLPLFHGAFITCAVVTAVNAFVLAMRIPAEERVLMSVPGYAEAMGHKPRFLPFSLPLRR
jgi:methyltransferase